MKNKKVIIWDFDGPIVDSWELAFGLTKQLFHDVDEELHRNLFNGNVYQELEKLKKKDLAIGKIQKIHDNYSKECISHCLLVDDVDNVIRTHSKEYI